MSGLTRTKRMRKVSPTNKRWNAPGRARPGEPLAERCETAIDGVCTGRAEVRHHIIRRGPGSSDEAWNTLDICNADHRHIHANVTWAKAHGYLRSRPPMQCPGVTVPPEETLPDGRCVCMGCGHGYLPVDGRLPAHARELASS